MALIDKASLLMVPSTYEAGKLYNVLPSGNRAPDSKGGAGYDQTRADFDFDRGSNAAATRIGSDGLIEKYRENVLLQSNQFDTTWTNTSSTETSGQEGYDGTNNAWKIDITATYGQIIQSVSISGVNCTSVYVKAGTLGFVRLRLDASPNAIVDFDLSDGSAAYTSGIVDASSESVGNGWYRISMVSNVSSSTFRIYPLIAANDLTGSSGSILIQSAQLESGLAATDVLTSGATTAKAGVLIDLPRINYDANGENGALLLEPSRLQMLRYSEYANEWDVNSNVTTTINAATSPEGVLNAVKLEGLTTSANNQIFRFIGSNTGVSVVGETFSCSLYIKPVNPNDVGKNIELSIQRTAGDYEGLNQTFEIDSADWKRYDLSYTFTGEGSGNQTGLTFKVLRNETTIDDIYCFGAQCEAGSYSTSYIPNHGTSGGVTRAIDSFTRTGISSLINSQEGVFFVEMAALSSNTGTSLLSLSDGGPTNNIYIGFSSTTNQISAVLYANGSAQGGVNSFSYDVKQMNKIAVSYKTNEFKLFINGSLVGTDTNATMPNANTLNKFSSDFGQSSFKLSAKLNQAVIFNEALTDAECITLTTL